MIMKGVGLHLVAHPGALKGYAILQLTPRMDRYYICTKTLLPWPAAKYCELCHLFNPDWSL